LHEALPRPSLAYDASGAMDATIKAAAMRYENDKMLMWKDVLHTLT